jgi:hypothetical protein
MTENVNIYSDLRWKYVHINRHVTKGKRKGEVIFSLRINIWFRGYSPEQILASSTKLDEDSNHLECEQCSLVDR